MTDPRGLSGFIVDVEALELDRTKITVYPGSGFFARRSREWIARTLKFQNTPAM